MLELNDIIHEVTIFCKKRDYKKRRLTWYKPKNDLTIVFAIQKSQYSLNAWQYCFGISINDLTVNATNSVATCHVLYQINHAINGIMLEPLMLCNLIERWETMYGTIDLLRKSAIEGRLPGIINTRAMTYLTTVDVSKLQDRGRFA